VDMRRTFINRIVSRHDRELVCQRDFKGNLVILRKRWALGACEFGEKVLRYLMWQPDFVFALTNNWQQNGVAINWGGEVVLERLKRLDLANRNVFLELRKTRQKAAESKARARTSDIDAMTREAMPVFKKAFKDVNTSNLAKNDLRRKHERRIKNG